MGQKHSTFRRKRLKYIRPAYSKTECTEIVEFEHSDITEAKPESSPMSAKNAINNELTSNNLPSELLRVIKRVEEIEKDIDSMSGSQLHLYFPTLKDDLHNNWEKVYGIRNTTEEIRLKKVEIIDKIKSILKNLNERYLKKPRNLKRS